MRPFPKSTPNTFLTIEDVAERLACSTRTVRRKIEAGELPAHKIGRSVRISRSDLEAFVRACRKDGAYGF